MLDHRVRVFTEALILADARTVFDLFVPTFRQEIGFARFDSALRSWRADRRPAIGQGRVVITRGISGQASTWVVFAGEDDYDYVYQGWVFADETWQLGWLSNILNASFDYGNRDSIEVRAIRAAALDWLVNDGGLREIPPGYRRPDTLLVIDTSGFAGWLPGQPTAVCTPEQFRAGTGLPAVPFGLRFALTRSFGNVALCAVDLRPLKPRRPGAAGRTRSIQIFLTRGRDGWHYNSTGSIF